MLVQRLARAQRSKPPHSIEKATLTDQKRKESIRVSMTGGIDRDSAQEKGDESACLRRERAEVLDVTADWRLWLAGREHRSKLTSKTHMIDISSSK